MHVHVPQAGNQIFVGAIDHHGSSWNGTRLVLDAIDARPAKLHKPLSQDSPTHDVNHVYISDYDDLSVEFKGKGKNCTQNKHHPQEHRSSF